MATHRVCRGRRRLFVERVDGQPLTRSRLKSFQRNARIWLRLRKSKWLLGWLFQTTLSTSQFQSDVLHILFYFFKSHTIVVLTRTCQAMRSLSLSILSRSSGCSCVYLSLKKACGGRTVHSAVVHTLDRVEEKPNNINNRVTRAASN